LALGAALTQTCPHSLSKKRRREKLLPRERERERERSQRKTTLAKNISERRGNQHTNELIQCLLCFPFQLIQLFLHISPQIPIRLLWCNVQKRVLHVLPILALKKHTKEARPPLTNTGMSACKHIELLQRVTHYEEDRRGGK